MDRSNNIKKPPIQNNRFDKFGAQEIIFGARNSVSYLFPVSYFCARWLASPATRGMLVVVLLLQRTRTLFLTDCRCTIMKTENHDGMRYGE